MENEANKEEVKRPSEAFKKAFIQYANAHNSAVKRIKEQIERDAKLSKELGENKL